MSNQYSGDTRIYEEAFSRYEAQRDELQNLRETALKTFRIEIILLGAIVAFADAFREFLSTVLSQPFYGTLSEWIFGLVFTLGLFLFFLSPILALEAVRQAKFDYVLDAEGLQDALRGEMKVITDSGVLEPTEDEKDWDKLMAKVYADAVSKNAGTIESSSKVLQLSHGALIGAFILTVVGFTYG